MFVAEKVLLHLVISLTDESEKFGDFFDMMCTNNFFTKIILSTRYGTNSCRLIDLMFCKVPHKQETYISSSVIISRMSDHFPCIVNLKTPGESQKQDKFIYTRTICFSAMLSFREKLSRQSAQVSTSIFLKNALN